MWRILRGQNASSAMRLQLQTTCGLSAPCNMCRSPAPPLIFWTPERLPRGYRQGLGTRKRQRAARLGPVDRLVLDGKAGGGGGDEITTANNVRLWVAAHQQPTSPNSNTHLLVKLINFPKYVTKWCFSSKDYTDRQTDRCLHSQQLNFQLLDS